jgi:hypothetical protein
VVSLGRAALARSGGIHLARHAETPRRHARMMPLEQLVDRCRTTRRSPFGAVSLD